MHANLASMYELVGRTEEALATYERTLKERERIQGELHADTLLSRCRLGKAYQNAGRLDEAIVLIEGAVAGLERVLDPEHPHVLDARVSLALSYEEAGRLGEAIPLLQRTLADCDRLYDPDHPDTIRCRKHLGTAYWKSGRTDQAIALLERVVADWDRLLDPEDPELPAARDALAMAYDAAGRPADSLSLYERTLRDRERSLGADHPRTLIARSNVALTYRDLGRLDEAIALLTAVVVGRRRVLGADHPSALRSRNHLALVYEEAGRLDEAIAQYEATLADCERVLGTDHELTGTVRFNLDDARRKLWEPRYDVERRLVEAKRQGDAAAYLRLLAGIDLFVLAPKQRSDDVVAGREDVITWRMHEVDGRDHAQVFTRGAITFRPDLVYLRRSLTSLAEQNWAAVVNRGIPAIEWTFSAEDIARAAADPMVEPPRNNVLLTEDGGPADGPLAFGLACGAVLAVNNSVPWNEIGVVYDDYIDGLKRLDDMWDVTTAEDWYAAIESLLSGDSSNAAATHVLELRRQTAPGHERYLELAAWQEAIAEWCRTREIERDTAGRLTGLAAMITRYEERFRVDGLLTPDGFVHSVLAYDIGRAVNMARWGVEARFCDRGLAERYVLRAGAQARQVYSRWPSFSAGYAMGRVLWFDEGDFGEWYDGTLTAHRVLTDDSTSPYRTIAW
jgi:tetratricopeptide (TPR) repeat protein